MSRCVPPITVLVLVALLPAFSFASQDEPSEDKGIKSHERLEITSVGNLTLSSGRPGSFRVYKTPDGTEGSLLYTQSRSLEEANRQIREWLKSSHTITSKVQERDDAGRVIGDRIVAVAKIGKLQEKGFLIVRRDGLNCYLIQALSLPVAMQVEELTK